MKKLYDHYGNEIVGNKLYRTDTGRFLITDKESNRTAGGWGYIDIESNDYDFFVASTSSRLYPISKEEVIKIFKDKTRNVKKNLESIEDHESLSKLYENKREKAPNISFRES